MEKRIKVIMLEDSEEDAGFILKTLHRAGLILDTKIVFTRNDFIDALQSFLPDLILSDHQLPQFNSMEALSICKQTSPLTPFILVTGAVSEEFAASIIKAGADDYVLKNNLKRLPTAIIQAIDKKLIQSSLHDTEKELIVAHERLLFHIENTPLGFIEWDTNLHIQLLSKRAEEIFGWKPKEWLKGEINELSQVHEEDREMVRKIADELISGAIERNSTQQRNITKDGRVIWCEWHNSVLKNRNGEVITIMSLVQDVTEKKLAEQAIKEQNTKLRDIAWLQSHGVRGPLARILGLINILQHPEDQQNKSELMSYLLASANELDHVIRNIVNKSEEVE
ncbi:MAG: PAS domain S-box protein [Cyclobacteriaceae bacterium]|nr:PAS domain S-box protein [Cyclobacteriaceae bacterium]